MSAEAVSWEHWSRAERWLLIGAAVGVIGLLPLLGLGMIDDRLYNGINPWIKPAKFFASLAVHLVTLAVLLRLLEVHHRKALVTTVLAAGTVIVAWGESLYIAVQAWRGRASHWNVETEWEAMIYGVMGIGAVYLIAVAGLLGLVILIAGRKEIGPGLRWGAGLGLVLGFATTLVVAGYLGGHEAGHWVGGERTDANGLPVVGWARDGGDLRVAHFFALHMMQALPLLGWGADRLRLLPRSTVLAGSALGVAVVAATFLQALSGRPFL